MERVILHEIYRRTKLSVPMTAINSANISAFLNIIILKVLLRVVYAYPFVFNSRLAVCSA